MSRGRSEIETSTELIGGREDYHLSEGDDRAARGGQSVELSALVQ